MERSIDNGLEGIFGEFEFVLDHGDELVFPFELCDNIFKSVDFLNVLLFEFLVVACRLVSKGVEISLELVDLVLIVDLNVFEGLSKLFKNLDNFLSPLFVLIHGLGVTSV